VGGGRGGSLLFYIVTFILFLNDFVFLFKGCIFVFSCSILEFFSSNCNQPLYGLERIENKNI